MSIKEMLAAAAVKAAEDAAAAVIADIGPAVGSYISDRLHQIFRANGTKFAKDASGAFVPETEEEHKLCQYYESKGYLTKVEAPADTKS